MTREERESALHCLKVMIDEEVCEECELYGTTGTDHCEADCVRVAIEALEDFEALNAINLDLADENEDLVERIGKLIGYIDFLRNTAQGKKKSLNLLEKVVKGQIKEIRAEGENFVKPKTGEWIPVTERLPEEDINVLVTMVKGRHKVMYAKYDGQLQKFCVGNYIRSKYVTAWMPLPQPYREVEE